MDEALYDEIVDTLTDRERWETKQKTWYTMRYTGIKRAKKPYKNAPDMHYPLADTMIEKLKPYYLAQIYAQSALAEFVSGPVNGRMQSEALSIQAAKGFDFAMKQYTNFERSIHTGVDFMLMYGRGPLKIIYDSKLDQVRFLPIRPIYIIVPTYTEDMQKADWLVHVIHLSKRQYLGNPAYKNKDKKFIESIAGKSEENYESEQDERLMRDGITSSTNENQIVLWEVYRREGSAKDGWKVKYETISPMLGFKTNIRDETTLDYPHGEIPICDLRYEIADLDYYGSRGATEIVSHFEMDLNKSWNSKLQFLDFHGQPNFKNLGGISPNPPNFKNEPGKIFPPGIDAVDPKNAPLDFEKEMQLQRSLAEDRLQVPDLSAGQHLSGTRGAKGEVTATQINAISGQAGQGNDYRGRTFRLQLGSIYNQAWALLVRFKSKDIQVLDDYSEIPAMALHTKYRIKPSGSADSFDQNARIQRALALYQTLAQAPGMKAAEFGKWLLEQSDPNLVKRLYEEPEEQKLGQIERQGTEMAAMEQGSPIQVRKDDVDYIHVAFMAQWVDDKIKSGGEIKPKTAMLAEKHLQDHAVAAQEKGDKQTAMLLQQHAQLFATLTQVAMSEQGQPGQDGMMAPMPQGAAGAGAAPPGDTPADQQDSDTAEQDADTKMLDSLTAAVKAGVPIDKDQFNAVLEQLGLPPIKGDGKIKSNEEKKIEVQKKVATIKRDQSGRASSIEVEG